LEVINVQDPTNPQLVYQSDPFPDVIYSFTISGSYGFAPKPYGIQIFDLSNPTNPQLVDTYELPSYYVQTIFISGTFAFVPEIRNSGEESGSGGLRILDISDPLNISQVGLFADGEGVESVAVRGDYAYIVSRKYRNDGGFTPGMAVVDISTISSPSEVYFTNKSYDMVAIYDHYLYVSDDYRGDVKIFDLTSPDTPAYLNTIYEPNDKILIAGTKLYIADTVYGLSIYDLTDPVTPSNLQEYNLGYRIPVYDVTVDDNQVYVAYSAKGLRIINLQSNLAELGVYNPFGYPVDAIYQDGFVYLLDLYNDLHILDVSNPAQPVEVTRFTQPIMHSSLQAVGSNLFIQKQYGFDILDITNPISPVIRSSYDTYDYLYKMIIQGDYVYLQSANEDYDLLVDVVNITNLDNPVQSDSLIIPGGINDMAMAGSYIFVLEEGYYSPELHVVDVSNPENLGIVKSITFSNYLNYIAIIGNYAYVANSTVGVQIINISNPLNPVIEGVYQIPNATGYGIWLKSVDGKLYVAAELEDDSIAQYIMDVSNPTNPVKVGDFKHFDHEITSFKDALKVENYIYYPYLNDGLLIYCDDCSSLDYPVYLPMITTGS